MPSLMKVSTTLENYQLILMTVGQVDNLMLSRLVIIKAVIVCNLVDIKRTFIGIYVIFH